ncbi:ELKS/Rab6-interacting/CAST family member 1-like [Macrobrachium rosenbergii]|uniref:ELKS/Rab6-interacting/CAST family member 1-like n=1 Tax=Macrobrachium rosenbergii TaxID=79674 RepID=UPI0034D43383
MNEGGLVSKWKDDEIRKITQTGAGDESNIITAITLVHLQESVLQEDENANSDYEEDNSYCEDHYSDSREEDSLESEDHNSDTEQEITYLDASRQVEKLIKENEIVSRLQQENFKKDEMINELKKKVEWLTEEGLKKEENIRYLESLSQQKDKQISSVSTEMQSLRNEVTEKAKDTELQIKEMEEKDQKLIILENTVVVLEMEKDTLHRELQERENIRTEMQVRLNKLNEDLQRMRQENVRKQKQVESLHRENEHKTLKLNGLEEKLQVLTTEKRLAQENLENLDLCKIEIAEKKEELEKLKEQNLHRDTQILRLENECTKKHKEFMDLLKESKSVVAEKSKAIGKMNEMTRRTIQLEFELAEAKEALEIMEFEKIEAILEIERLHEETSTKDTKITSLEKKVKILEGEKASEKMNGHNLIREESEVCTKEKTMIKMVAQEQPVSETKAVEKKTLNKTRRLIKPKIDCKVLYQRMDIIEEGLRQIMALQRPSTEAKTHSKDPTTTPLDKTPLNKNDVHKKMRQESAARLRTLERESEMVKKLYKINSVT